MSMLRGAGARLTAGGALAMLALSGCSATPAPPPRTASATPTSAPIFANDDEALAAAKKAYGEYLKVSDAVAAEGGAEPERFRTVATGRALASAMKSAAQYHQAAAHSVGATSFDLYGLQSFSKRQRQAEIVVFVCDDVSDLDVRNAAGESLVRAERPPRTPFKLTFLAEADSEIRLDEKQLWKGANFC